MSFSGGISGRLLTMLDFWTANQVNIHVLTPNITNTMPPNHALIFIIWKGSPQVILISIRLFWDTLWKSTSLNPISPCFTIFCLIILKNKLFFIQLTYSGSEWGNCTAAHGLSSSTHNTQYVWIPFTNSLFFQITVFWSIQPPYINQHHNTVTITSLVG